MLDILAALVPSVGETIKETSSNVVSTGAFNWDEWIDKGIKIGIWILIVLPSLKLVCMACFNVLKKTMTQQGAILLTRWLWRIGLLILLLSILKEIGFNLVALMGTAGIAGVAIAFASQNSLSNVISGFFLMGERSISLGDLIEINNVKGRVEEIGVLSIILRTLDNRQVRIPNETVLKGTMINITRYPIRRYDLEVGVSYAENIDKVLGVLKQTLLKNTYCLDEPEPLIVFTGFGDSSCNFFIGAWCRREDYDTLRTSIAREIKEAFDRTGIEIPFPHRVLSSSKASTPIQVEILPTQTETPVSEKKP